MQPKCVGALPSPSARKFYSMLLQAGFYLQQQRLETDAQRLVRKHLSSPQHVITEEELARIRVGVFPIVADPFLKNKERGTGKEL